MRGSVRPVATIALIHVPDPDLALLPLAGGPLIAHTVRAASLVPTLEQVWVRTDDERLRSIVETYGAKTCRDLPEAELRVELDASFPFRPRSLVASSIARMRTESLASLVTAVKPEGSLWREGRAEAAMLFDWQEVPSMRVVGAGKGVGFVELHPLDAVAVRSAQDLDAVRPLAESRGARFTPPSLARLQLVAFDFDGVMTDDTVIVREDGTESVIANRGDGMGILRLKRSGVRAVVISKETNVVVAARCRKLDLQCHHGIDDKLTLLKELAEQESVAREHIAFVGNDVNDVECIAWAGCGIAVANSRPEALAVADWVTRASGGRGAVREICEAIIAERT